MIQEYFVELFLFFLFRSSILQHVRGSATVGLAYINPDVPVRRTDSTEGENNQPNEVGIS